MSTPEQLHDQMRDQMTADLRDLLGPGYIDRYYADLAAGFVSVAEWYAEALASTVGSGPTAVTHPKGHTA